jgi:hypothetical protein
MIVLAVWLVLLAAIEVVPHLQAQADEDLEQIKRFAPRLRQRLFKRLP